MGRPKGKPNTQTGQLRDMILTALTDEGGIDYLRGLARQEPKSFAALLGKVLPLQVTGEGGGPVGIVIEQVRFSESK